VATCKAEVDTCEAGIKDLEVQLKLYMTAVTNVGNAPNSNIQYGKECKRDR